MRVYLKESIEFQPIEVELDGTPHNTFEVCIVPDGERPASWQPSTLLGGKPGVMIEGLALGAYDVYVKVTSTPEVPVMKAGVVVIK